MYGSTITSLMRLLGVGVLVLGLSAPALAVPPGPPEEVPPWLGIILDRLDDLQEDVDNLPGALGPCEVPPVWGADVCDGGPVCGGAGGRGLL